MAKVFSIRNQFLAALALAPLVLFGCSSTEETSEPDPTSQSGGEEDCSVYTGAADIRECEIRNEMRN